MKKSVSALGRIRVVLINTFHPGNIGAVARAMKTMGLHQLYLVNPKRYPDAEATTRATGAADVLEQAVVCASLDEALQGTVLAVGLTARRRDLSHPLLTPRAAAPELLSEAQHGDVALLFGAETSGLTNDELDRCQMLVMIPSDPEFASLNLASAVQVMAYELRTASSEGVLPMTEEVAAGELVRASLDEIEGFYGHLERTMVSSGFLDPTSPKRLMHRLRRLFSRARLEQNEINILRGILTSLDPARPKNRPGSEENN